MILSGTQRCHIPGFPIKAFGNDTLRTTRDAERAGARASGIDAELERLDKERQLRDAALVTADSEFSADKAENYFRWCRNAGVDLQQAQDALINELCGYNAEMGREDCIFRAQLQETDRRL